MATKKILMLVGGKWHPWESCAAMLKETVQATGRYSVVVTEDRDALKAASLRKYSAVVVYTQGGKLTPDQEKGLTGFVEKGGALVGLHSATAAWQSNRKYIDMIGGVFAKHGPVTEFPVNIVDTEHQITQRIPDFRVTDEFYILDKFDRDKVNVLATAMWRHKEHPVAYTKTYGKGRVFYFALHLHGGKVLVEQLQDVGRRAGGKLGVRAHHRSVAPPFALVVADQTVQVAQGGAQLDHGPHHVGHEEPLI